MKTDKEKDKEFGQQLQKCRKKANLTQGELGKSIKINISTISRIEKGEIRPNSKMLQSLVFALSNKVPRDELDKLINLAGRYFTANSDRLVTDPIIETISYAFENLESDEEKKQLSDDLQNVLGINRDYFESKKFMGRKEWGEAIKILDEVGNKIDRQVQRWNLRVSRELGISHYGNVSFPLALSHYRSALANAEQLGNQELERGELLIRIGNLYRRRGGKRNCEDARDYYNKAKEILGKLPTGRFYEADCTRKIVGAWIFEGRPDMAKELCDQNLNQCKKDGYIKGYYKALQHQAWVYSMLGRWNEAIRLCNEALDYANKNEESDNLQSEWDKIRALRYLGDAYRTGRYLDEAEKRYNEALALFKNGMGHTRTGGLIMLGLAKVYLKKPDGELKAKKYLSEGMKVHGGQGEDFRAIEFYVEKGQLLLNEGRLMEARELLELARDKYLELENIINYANVLVPLSELAYKEKNITEIEAIGKGALSKNNGLINNYLEQIFFIHGKALLDMGNFQDATRVWIKSAKLALEFNTETFRDYSKKVMSEIEKSPDVAGQLCESFMSLWESEMNDKRWKPIDQEAIKKLLENIQRQQKEAVARTHLK